jgi:Fe-S-cluster containining protein
VCEGDFVVASPVFQLAVEHRMGNLACPFLTETNVRGIFDDRPRACRMFPTEPWPESLAWPAPPESAA